MKGPDNFLQILISALGHISRGAVPVDGGYAPESSKARRAVAGRPVRTADRDIDTALSIAARKGWAVRM